jgi:hypothetical protein
MAEPEQVTARVGAHDPAHAEELSAKLESLAKISSRTAVSTALALAIVVGSLGFSAWKLDASKQQIARAEHELTQRQKQLRELEKKSDEAKVELVQRQAVLDSLSKDVESKTRQLETSTKQKVELQDLVAKSANPTLIRNVQAVAPFPAVHAQATTAAPLGAVARVQMSVSPTNRSAGGRRLFNVRFWVDLPKERVPEVVQVQYFFNHPTFVPKNKTSFDSSNGFSIEQACWGCLDNVEVTLIGRDAKRHKLGFPMCASPAWTAANSKSE